MKLHIQCFGPAREIIGTKDLELEVTGVTTARALKEHLLHTWPEFLSLDSLKIAVNEAYVTDEQTISDKDEIAIIPPVSGG